ncbi:MAG: hypothetical protein U0936_12830 [Planctomycetaceae bacterium]
MQEIDVSQSCFWLVEHSSQRSASPSSVFLLPETAHLGKKMATQQIAISNSPYLNHRSQFRELARYLQREFSGFDQRLVGASLIVAITAN